MGLVPYVEEWEVLMFNEWIAAMTVLFKEFNTYLARTAAVVVVLYLTGVIE